jgi:hypothetical protein
VGPGREEVHCGGGKSCISSQIQPDYLGVFMHLQKHTRSPSTRLFEDVKSLKMFYAWTRDVQSRPFSFNIIG